MGPSVWRRYVRGGRGAGGLGRLGSRALAFAVAVAGLAPEPVAGDVLVNDPSTDPGNASTQFETALAADGSTLCAGWLDTGPPNGTLAAFASSVDGGSSWVDRGEIAQQGDPAIAAHRASKTFYYAQIATVGGRGTIGVARSDDGCQSFGPAANAAPAASALQGVQFNDKPWIAVDNTGGGRDGQVYVCWTRFYDASGDGIEDSSELRVSSSTDGGSTWPTELVVTGPGRAPFGCNVQVGPAGEVYLAWADRVGGDIWFARSLDGARAFSTRVVSRGFTRHPGSDRIADCAPPRPTLTGDILQAHQAWMAVDTSDGPRGGTVFVAWVTDPAGPVDNADVYLGSSGDGGNSWSEPIQVGTDGGPTDQFEPNLAVGADGQLAIAWYDRRADPTQNLRIGVYTSFSFDGGRSLTPPRPISDTDFPTPPLLPHYDPIARQCHWGEYMAVAADAASAYYLWTGNARTVTNAAYPSGRPDPDIYFDRVDLPPPPSNEFELERVRRNRGAGTAKLFVSLPGPGEATLRGSGLRRDRVVVEAAELVKLEVAAAGRARRRLVDRGTLVVRPSVRFTPEYGNPNQDRLRVRLRKR